MTGVNGPRRLALLRAPAGWMLESIRVHGIDATDRVIAFGRAEQSLTDVEVIVTDRVNALTATVLDDRGQAAGGARVILFPTDRDRWYPASRYLRLAAADAGDGVATFTGVPFGSYYAAAVQELPDGGDDAWQDPDYLALLARGAASLTMRDGEPQTATLHVR
jgi:hypothetical protein